MLNTYRFIGPTGESAARAPAQPLAPPPIATRSDPSGQASASPQDLAAAITTMGRQPQGSATAVAENLAAEALLDYARRNSMDGQADPSGLGGGQGAGGYGAAPSDPGGQQVGPGLKPPGLAGALINMGLQAGSPQAQGFLSSWLSGD